MAKARERKSESQANPQIETTRKKICEESVEKTDGVLKMEEVSGLYSGLEMITMMTGRFGIFVCLSSCCLLYTSRCV